MTGSVFSGVPYKIYDTFNSEDGGVVHGFLHVS